MPKRSSTSFEGEIHLQLGGEVIAGETGQLVRIPRGTPHGFAIKSQTARVLNPYVPAVLGLMVAMLSTPAAAATLPPPGAQKPPADEQAAACTKRLQTLSTQSRTSQPGLLAEHRGPQAAGRPDGLSAPD